MAISEATREQMQQLAARYPQPRSALLPMLHLVQSVEGEVTTDGIEACADVLSITPAEVKAVSRVDYIRPEPKKEEKKDKKPSGKSKPE